MNKNSCEIEVLINGKSLKEYLSSGKIYIEGKQGSAFSLRFRNNSSVRKLFIPSIDGLSIMDGKEANFDSSGYILRPYSSLTIDGWRTSDSEVAQFFFSAPNDSYRKRMEKGNNLGVIGCAVFDEKEKPVVEHHYHHFPVKIVDPWPYPRPWWLANNVPNHGSLDYQCRSMDSVQNMQASSVKTSAMNASLPSNAMSQDLGTGFGEAKRSEVVKVDFERCATPSALFEIYYNTREQLEKLGIDFKETIYVTPQAFPGEYCPPPTR